MKIRISGQELAQAAYEYAITKFPNLTLDNKSIWLGYDRSGVLEIYAEIKTKE